MEIKCTIQVEIPQDIEDALAELGKKLEQIGKQPDCTMSEWMDRNRDVVKGMLTYPKFVEAIFDSSVLGDCAKIHDADAALEQVRAEWERVRMKEQPQRMFEVMQENIHRAEKLTALCCLCGVNGNEYDELKKKFVNWIEAKGLSFDAGYDVCLERFAAGMVAPWEDEKQNLSTGFVNS